MEYNIDRRVVLNQDSEFKNLYEWSLQELDADGKKVGRDQIPWALTLSFTASELTLGDTLAIKPDYQDDSDDAKMAVQEKQVIFAKLHPTDRGRFARATSYSMFGADRVISNFQLHIMPLTHGDEQERCIAWGVVSYTAEIDFLEETVGDSMGFYLIVRPETFARYAEKVASSAVDHVVLQVGRVAGFYSDWSPSIFADEVKVLADYRDQKIEIPTNCEISPPRLGEVIQAELSFNRVTKLGNARLESSDIPEDRPERNPEEHTGGSGEAKASKEAEADPIYNKTSPQERIDGAQPAEPDLRLAVADDRTVNLLSSMRVAAWIIVGLLVLILVNWRL
ncbi:MULTISPECIES: hypothetical protein [Mesorhizobium]|uniref:Uncharacterized protein n=2 Tax=Mesorhizobium TaxID=68287 RepID=A0A1A5J8G2_RHILI|nr:MULTISPECIES: hypothetical protein [Mesorhizobium]ETA72690.1 hypothetical protein MesloDRAFT_1571 [Mesorhizobium japonicum R7A]MBE1710252.1 hypothetical protein [Mesorhizobium japonicum]MBE1716896.1 hypothetical protein [Mesorhizobium japonicum]MUT25230.1 hypothetical protein [Mesorhizobium japonicum]MUT28779.1 hypothetical protein [Mesorhizobium japonicum]